MKTLTIGTKAQADNILTNSLFVPVNGGTLTRERWDRGNYANNLKGRTISVPDTVHALWTEKRRDSDGEYYALFCLSAREAQAA